QRVEAGLDINYNDPNKGTALMQAVHRDNFEIVRYLLEKGADPSIVGPEGKKAPAYSRSHKMMKLLSELGIRIKIDREVVNAKDIENNILMDGIGSAFYNGW